MKKIVKLVVLLFITTGCKAQVESLEGYNGQGVAGRHYKDLNNVFNTFEGTYLYTNGNKSLKFVFQKKEDSSMGDVYFEDLLIGEFEYKENDVTIVSTLNKLTETYANAGNHTASGNNILIGNKRNCVDCLPTEKRVECFLGYPNSESIAMLILRKTMVGSNEAISMTLVWQTSTRTNSISQSNDVAFPSGTYLLIKQP